jgi:hypothetical protein
MTTTTTLVKQQPIKKRRRTAEPFTGPQETVEEFLARGGEITMGASPLAPGQLASDPPRRIFSRKGISNG